MLSALIANAKKLARTIQTDFPLVQDARHDFQRFYRGVLQLPHEADFNALSLFNSAPQAIYLDVGANRGQSIDSILLKRPLCQVVSFEPNPLLMHRLESIHTKTKRVALHNCALGAQHGEFTLFVPYYKGYMFDGLASLDRQSAADWLPTRLFRYQPQHLEIVEVSCTVKPLDSFDLAPFFIKMDVQGHELSVLLGAAQTLERHQPILLIESPTPEVIAHLRARAYEPYAYRSGALRRDEFGSLNTFFLPPAKQPLVTGLDGA